ncbi:MAG: hypothetical protein ACP5MI_02610 [Candidatus Kryptoniota bacterium]
MSGLKGVMSTSIFLINIASKLLGIIWGIIMALVLASCSTLQPTASVHIFPAEINTALATPDTMSILINIDSETDFVFDVNGSNQIHSSSGEKMFLARNISTGWYYADIVGNEMWVRGMPIYLKRGGDIYIQFLKTGVYVNYKPFFKVEKSKSIYNSFTPILTIGCYGCSGPPEFRIDNARINPVQPYIPLSAEWHSIEIYSPMDNIQLYYRDLFANYTVTTLILYPVESF